MFQIPNLNKGVLIYATVLEVHIRVQESNSVKVVRGSCQGADLVREGRYFIRITETLDPNYLRRDTGNKCACNVDLLV